MNHTLAKVIEIESKLLKVIDIQEDLKKKTEDYVKEIQELKEIHDKQRNTILELEEKINRIRLVKTIETQEGAGEARERISKLVREIDRCIGLLNT